MHTVDFCQHDFVKFFTEKRSQLNNERSFSFEQIINPNPDKRAGRY